MNLLQLPISYCLLWSFVMSGLLIYIGLCSIIYFKSKQKMYLYYGIYNLLLFFYIYTKTPFESILVFSFPFDSRFSGVNYFVQILYNSFLFFFYNDFVEYKIYFPKFEKRLILFLRIILASSSIVFIESLVFNNKLINLYFFYIFIPLMNVFVIYAIVKASQITASKLKYFIILGTFFYNVFAYISLYKTLINDYAIEPINYFLIGIVLESVVFVLGITYKINLIYTERIQAQKRIIKEQNQIQHLKENHQKKLEFELNTKVEELKKALQKSEDEKLKSLTLTFENEISLLKLESLRSQMNPHFIFNALNSIKVYLIENDKEKAIYYLNKFSKLIRKILESSRTDSISLEEELNIIELYMSIENIRFNNEIDFLIIKNEINLTSIKVPGLILQPFIENSLWHGLMLKDGKKNITINVAQEKAITILTILDNGIGRKKAEENVAKKSFKRESLGLQFTNERLKYFNQKLKTNYNFTFEDLYDEIGIPIGTKVEFKFS
ncbi:histidine kinase [Flavobacterium sp. SUN052]|uniref:sensor histidine kinase n=1 Tax=Flavobacterium sp. SUN052 TaxID=3002441 RepID=UPI00237D60A9|nr:histidine kinase [Flavobacterium sp. SUN052]MEC4004119.1 histidine kinase [Flavobacterium sp. SUN052]